MSYSDFLHPGEIIDKIAKFEGIIKQILGDLHDYLLFDQNRETRMHILSEIYGYKNVWDCLPRKVNKKDFRMVTSTIFRFSEEAEKRASLSAPTPHR